MLYKVEVFCVFWVWCYLIIIKKKKEREKKKKWKYKSQMICVRESPKEPMLCNYVICIGCVEGLDLEYDLKSIEHLQPLLNDKRNPNTAQSFPFLLHVHISLSLSAPLSQPVPNQNHPISHIHISPSLYQHTLSPSLSLRHITNTQQWPRPPHPQPSPSYPPPIPPPPPTPARPSFISRPPPHPLQSPFAPPA